MSFDDVMIDAVWAKANRCGAGNERKGFRKDECTAWMKRERYGDRDSIYGWEIDHIKPKAEGGTDVLENLRPLHWLNNACRQDGKLKRAVYSEGIQNIDADTRRELKIS